MSIQPLLHLTLVGLESGRETVMRDLQQQGFAHLEAVRPETTLAAADVSTAAEGRKALRYLEAAHRPWHATHDPTGFSAEATTQRALELERRTRELRDERHALRRRIAELAPWGAFEFDEATPDARRFWFYVVPNHQLRNMPDGLCWQAVHRDSGSSYLVIIAHNEPAGVPGPRTHAGARGLAQLHARLDAVQVALDEIESHRAREASWRELLRESLDQLDDEANLRTALLATGSEGPFFIATAWIPAARAPDVEGFAARLRLAHLLRKPQAGEVPPTLLANHGISAFGEDILRFYEVPAYGGWDPSASVFWFLIVFMAVMIGDAGYSLLLTIGLLAFWRVLGGNATLRRARRFAVVASAFSLAWGVAIGSWFGAPPTAGSLLASMVLFDLTDTTRYVTLAVGLGVVQLVWANLASAWHSRSADSIARIGWVMLLLTGVVAWQWPASVRGQPVGPAVWLALGGVAAIIGFSAPRAAPLSRLGQGAFALTRIVGLASDVLSYLRLFAIGFAGAALAGAFGALADQASAGSAGLGGLLAFLILLLGHGANLVLGVASAIVHGLRLNLIEYLNWSIADEGRQFKAFSRKVGNQ